MAMMNLTQQTYYNRLIATARLINWQLLSNTYVDSKTKLTFLCDKNHQVKKRPCDFNVNVKCSVCGGCNPEIAKENFLSLLHIENYKLLSEYNGSANTILLLCPNSHYWETTPSRFKNLNQRCSSCPPRHSIATKERFINLLESEGYHLLGEYTYYNIKVLIQCPNKHNIEMTANTFEKGCRCPKCQNMCPIQTEERFLEAAKAENYIILDNYINNHTKVRAICSNQHLIDVIPTSFLSGVRCIKCQGLCPIQAKEKFLSISSSESYTVLDYYVNNSTKLTMVCPKGHIIKIAPYHFKGGVRCSKCQGKCPLQAKEDFLLSLFKENYKIYSEYKSTSDKVKVKCPNNHEWEIAPNYFKLGVRCPNCPRKESKGETLTKRILENIGINYSVQKTFPFIQNRRYDFYFTYDNFEFIVEFDGKQHFYYTPHFHKNITEFHQSQYVDIIKTISAINNGYKIIRISYKEKNDIENHIKCALKSLQNDEKNLYISNVDLYKYMSTYQIVTITQ